MIAYIYYVHRAFVRFEHSLCCGSLMTTYITILSQLVEHSLVHWYQQCVTTHHVPKSMSCHKATVVITGSAVGRGGTSTLLKNPPLVWNLQLFPKAIPFNSKITKPSLEVCFLALQLSSLLKKESRSNKRHLCTNKSLID